MFLKLKLGVELHLPLAVKMKCLYKLQKTNKLFIASNQKFFDLLPIWERIDNSNVVASSTNNPSIYPCKVYPADGSTFS